MKILNSIMFFIIVCSLSCKATEEQNKKENEIIYDLNKIITYEYSVANYNNIISYYKSLSEKNKEKLIGYLEENCLLDSNINNCINILVFFSFNKDDYALKRLNSLYYKISNQEILSAIELYFYNLGHDQNNNLEKYFNKLKNINNADNNLLFLAILCDSTSGIIPILLTIYEEMKLDGSGAELWFGVMSWIERNIDWLSAKRRTLVKQRMDEYYIK